jgi:hypothetical protein
VLNQPTTDFVGRKLRRRWLCCTRSPVQPRRPYSMSETVVSPAPLTRAAKDAAMN